MVLRYGVWGFVTVSLSSSPARRSIAAAYGRRGTGIQVSKSDMVWRLDLLHLAKRRLCSAGDGRSGDGDRAIFSKPKFAMTRQSLDRLLILISGRFL